MDRLHNTVRPYAWGSTTAIPALLGEEPSGEPQAEMWIVDAATLLSRGPDGRTPINLDDVDEDVVNMVIRELVANRLKRPDSATQVSVSVDDGQVTRTYESGTGQLQVLPWMWTMLQPNGEGSGGAFTIRTPHRPRSAVYYCGNGWPL